MKNPVLLVAILVSIAMSAKGFVCRDMHVKGQFDIVRSKNWISSFVVYDHQTGRPLSRIVKDSKGNPQYTQSWDYNVVGQSSKNTFYGIDFARGLIQIYELAYNRAAPTTLLRTRAAQLLGVVKAPYELRLLQVEEQRSDGSMILTLDHLEFSNTRVPQIKTGQVALKAQGFDGVFYGSDWVITVESFQKGILNVWSAKYDTVKTLEYGAIKSIKEMNDGVNLVTELGTFFVTRVNF